MTQVGFEQVRSLVLAQPALQERLRDLEDRAEFTRLLLEIARAHGHELAEEDVAAAMQASRRAWIERWIR